MIFPLLTRGGPPYIQQRYEGGGGGGGGAKLHKTSLRKKIFFYSSPPPPACESANCSLLVMDFLSGSLLSRTLNFVLSFLQTAEIKYG